MINKMTDAFKKAQGGMFSETKKADVGNNVLDYEKNNIKLMSWADPFFYGGKYPEEITNAAIKSLTDGTGLHYTMPVGNPNLKIELAKYIKEYNHLDVDPMRNILITPGSDSGLFFAILPFIEKDDEVMIIDPSYPNNVQDVEIMGGKVVLIPSSSDTNYHPSIEEFEKRLTKKTKMIILTNPNNPTTTVYRREWLEELSKFIIKNDLVCVVDQAFEFPVFDGLEMVTMASLPGMFERTVTVCSISKVMGLSGLRVGYIVANDIIMDKLYGTAVSVVGATNTASQMAVIAALQNKEFIKEFGKEHERRRDIVYEYLKDIPGTSLKKSESGFLTWMNISCLGTSNEVVEYLMKEAKVAVNAGNPYGPSGEGFIRIVHGTTETTESLTKVLKDIREALLKLSKEKIK